MEHGSLEYFRWFYAGRLDRPGDMEKRWHPDLVIHQSLDFPDTQGTFTGFEGLAEMNRELGESWQGMSWEPLAVEALGDDRYFVRLEISGRGRGSGIELSDEIGHIVRLRDGKASRLDTYLDVDAGRKAAGLA